MKVKKYSAATVKEAFALAKAELGEDAVLLRQRTLPAHPQDLTPPLVEIMAAVDEDDLRQPTPAPKPAPKLEPKPFFETTYTARPAYPTGRILSSADFAPPSPSTSSTSAAPAASAASSPSVSPSASTESFNASDPNYLLWREMRSIRSMLQQHNAPKAAVEAMTQWQTLLREAMLPNQFVDEILYGLEEILTPAALQRSDMVTAALTQRLSALMPPSLGTLRPGRPGNPLVFVLVGPTGVGKTTTLAKLAARYSIHHRLPVALITADTFRIGAVGQLRTYSDLMRAPLEIAYTPQELSEHVARHQDKSIIFVDTPGRSPTDTEQLEILRSFVSVLPNPHLQIAVAAGTMLGDARRIIEKFSVAKPYGLLLTKLDETTVLGPACALLAETQLPLSFVTTGQRVPEDIELANIDKLVDRTLQNVRQQIEISRNAPGSATSVLAEPTFAANRQSSIQA